MKWGEYANSACIVMLSAESAHRQDVLDPIMWEGYKKHFQEIVERVKADEELDENGKECALYEIRAYVKQVAAMVRW